MKRLVILPLAVVLLFAGCGGDEDGEDLSTDFGPTDRMEYNHRHDGEGLREIVVTYHGHPLYCIDEYVHGGAAPTCDFVRWHQENDPPEKTP